MWTATHAGPARGRHVEQGGRDVVDQVAPASQGRLGHRRLHRVDRDPDVARQRLDHRDHPGQLDLFGHGLGPRAGRLTPDVDDVGPLGHHVEPVGHGGLGGQVAPPVGERVRRHVENAHDERSVGQNRYLRTATNRLRPHSAM